MATRALALSAEEKQFLDLLENMHTKFGEEICSYCSCSGGTAVPKVDYSVAGEFKLIAASEQLDGQPSKDDPYHPRDLLLELAEVGVAFKSFKARVFDYLLAKRAQRAAPRQKSGG